MGTVKFPLLLPQEGKPSDDLPVLPLQYFRKEVEFILIVSDSALSPVILRKEGNQIIQKKYSQSRLTAARTGNIFNKFSLK